MSFADSLRQQARWVCEARDPDTPDTQRITMDDVDCDALEGAAAELERYEAQIRALQQALRTERDARIAADERAKDAEEERDTERFWAGDLQRIIDNQRAVIYGYEQILDLRKKEIAKERRAKEAYKAQLERSEAANEKLARQTGLRIPREGEG